MIESVRQDSEPSAADNLKSLVQECGVSPHKISELLQELPPQRFSDVLIDHYFAAMLVDALFVDQSLTPLIVAIGRDIPYARLTFGLHTHLFAPTGWAPILTMLASFRCCSWCLLFQCDWHLNILLATREQEE
jgi:hypothetical protein